MKDTVEKAPPSADGSEHYLAELHGRARHQRDGAATTAAGERMWANIAKGDWSEREADELSPQSFAVWGGE